MLLDRFDGLSGELPGQRDARLALRVGLLDECDDRRGRLGLG